MSFLLPASESPITTVTVNMVLPQLNTEKVFQPYKNRETTGTTGRGNVPQHPFQFPLLENVLWNEHLEQDINNVMQGWVPYGVILKEATIPPQEDCDDCLILSVQKTSNLMDARERLQQLPHIPSTVAYEPYIVVSSLGEITNNIVRNFNTWFAGKVVYPVQVGYELSIFSVVNN